MNKKPCECGCGGKVSPKRKYLKGHYWKKHPPCWNGGKKILKDRILIYSPNHPRAGNYGYVKESHLIVEKAMGKPLPPKAEVHHIDGNPHNNSNNNLVVCENTYYHSILHQRARALKECGNSRWLKCRLCKKYDKPENLTIYPRCNRKNGFTAFHMSCQISFNKKYKEAKKSAHTQRVGGPKSNNLLLDNIL